MFKDFQSGFQVHILDKSGAVPSYKIGKVVSVSPPRLEQKPMMQGQMANPMMFTDRVIDLTVEHDGQTKTYVVPETGNVAPSAALTLACSTEPILNEVRAMLRTSTDIINSVDHHKEVVNKCESIMQEMNPTFAESKAQNERISMMEKSIADMTQTMGEIRQLLQSSQTKKTKE
ncbi:MAG: hypothetical protein J1E33_06565 [Alistipes sp.]|nr:hypothetical protein [Alistipes sp.]